MDEGYSAKGMDHAAASAFPQLREHLELLGDVGDVMWKTLNAVRSIRAGDKEEMIYKRECTFFLVKAAKTHRAIELLIGAGLLQDARVLLRCLFELLVTLRYIKDKPEERARLFAEYDHVVRWEWVQAASKRELPGAGPLGKYEKESRKLEKDCKRVKSRYPRRTWSGVSVAKMAEHVGMGAHYVFYKWDSGYVHSGVTTSRDYLRTDSRGGLIITPWPATADHFLGTIFEACAYSYEVAVSFRDAFGPELEKDPAKAAELKSAFTQIDAKVSALSQPAS
jgi:hypothetical protein